MIIFFAIKILSEGKFVLRNFKNSEFSDSKLRAFKNKKASKILQKKTLGLRVSSDK